MPSFFRELDTLFSRVKEMKKGGHNQNRDSSRSPPAFEQDSLILDSPKAAVHENHRRSMSTFDTFFSSVSSVSNSGSAPASLEFIGNEESILLGDSSLSSVDFDQKMDGLVKDSKNKTPIKPISVSRIPGITTGSSKNQNITTPRKSTRSQAQV